MNQRINSKSSKEQQEKNGEILSEREEYIYEKRDELIKLIPFMFYGYNNEHIYIKQKIVSIKNEITADIRKSLEGDVKLVILELRRKIMEEIEIEIYSEGEESLGYMSEIILNISLIENQIDPFKNIDEKKIFVEIVSLVEDFLEVKENLIESKVIIKKPFFKDINKRIKEMEKYLKYYYK